MTSKNQITELELPHLAPALAALGIAVAAAVWFCSYANDLESRFLDALAPQMFEQKLQGSALQTLAFGRDDLLPVYGSSELRIQRNYQQAFHASQLLLRYPSGFTIFPIGKAETTPLIFAQKLAAVGNAARAKKVVFSISPVWFYQRGQAVDQASYAGNFSRLQAGELAFSSDLSWDLKKALAERMLQYPGTLQDDPLDLFALERLADGSPRSRIEYLGAWPMGKLQNLVRRFQDDFESLVYVGRQPHLDVAVPRETAPIDWSALRERAQREYAGQSDDNPFGLDNERWTARYRDQIKADSGQSSDKKFAADLDAAAGWWADLDLLLRAARELGVHALLMSQPLHGAYWDACGVSAEGRRAYYLRLESVAAKYGVEVVDFSDREYDHYFSIDYDGHLSPVGWVWYTEAMDRFFHNLPATPPAPIEAASDAPNVEGSLDSATATEATGWAWDSAHPNLCVAVDVYADGKLVGTARADLPRADLVAAGKGDGKHGFAFPIRASLLDGKAHLIAAKVNVTGAAVELNGSPHPMDQRAGWGH